MSLREFLSDPVVRAELRTCALWTIMTGVGLYGLALVSP